MDAGTAPDVIALSSPSMCASPHSVSKVTVVLRFALSPLMLLSWWCAVPLRDESAKMEQFGAVLGYGWASPVQYVLNVRSLTGQYCIDEMSRLSGIPSDRLLLCTTFYGKVSVWLLWVKCACWCTRCSVAIVVLKPTRLCTSFGGGLTLVGTFAVTGVESCAAQRRGVRVKRQRSARRVRAVKPPSA
jgi:hypothetical protein